MIFFTYIEKVLSVLYNFKSETCNTNDIRLPYIDNRLNR